MVEQGSLDKLEASPPKLSICVDTQLPTHLSLDFKP